MRGANFVSYSLYLFEIFAVKDPFFLVSFLCICVFAPWQVATTTSCVRHFDMRFCLKILLREIEKLKTLEMDRNLDSMILLHQNVWFLGSKNLFPQKNSANMTFVLLTYIWILWSIDQWWCWWLSWLFLNPLSSCSDYFPSLLTFFLIYFANMLVWLL